MGLSLLLEIACVLGYIKTGSMFEKGLERCPYLEIKIRGTYNLIAW